MSTTAGYIRLTEEHSRFYFLISQLQHAMYTKYYFQIHYRVKQHTNKENKKTQNRYLLNLSIENDVKQQLYQTLECISFNTWILGRLKKLHYRYINRFLHFSLHKFSVDEILRCHNLVFQRYSKSLIIRRILRSQ